MWSDVVELRNFYRSRIGGTAHRMIRDHVRAGWEDVTGMNVLGIGYPTPYLGQFRSEAQRVLAVMPARQGVIRWPSEGANLAALADEAELPLPDLSIDRVLLVHALESAEQLRPMLREIWRVMADGGRMIAVVPNRTGIWARLDRTPFGHGHPYSQSQLSRLLRDAMFNPAAALRPVRAAEPPAGPPRGGAGVGAHRRTLVSPPGGRAHRGGDQADLRRDAGRRVRAQARARAAAGKSPAGSLDWRTGRSGRSPWRVR